MLIRTVRSHALASRQIARRTWLGSGMPDVHADPREMATSGCKRRIRVSASPSGKVTFIAPGWRSTARPLMTAPGNASPIRCSNAVLRDRHASTSAVVGKWRHATPNPTQSAVGRVPGRRPPSCSPPKLIGLSKSRISRRTHKAPTPFGPPALCAERLTRSASKDITSTAAQPSA